MSPKVMFCGNQAHISTKKDYKTKGVWKNFFQTPFVLCRPSDETFRLHVVELQRGELHLQQRLLPDDRLVQQHVVEHRAKRVAGVRILRGDLDRLGDGNSQ